MRLRSRHGSVTGGQGVGTYSCSLKLYAESGPRIEKGGLFSAVRCPLSPGSVFASDA
jgi:hypothetical protein